MLNFNGLASWLTSKFGPFFVNVTTPKVASEIRLDPFFIPQSLQSGPPSQSPKYLQAEPLCRSG
jgi:hypothetical protein